MDEGMAFFGPTARPGSLAIKCALSLGSVLAVLKP